MTGSLKQIIQSLYHLSYNIELWNMKIKQITWKETKSYTVNNGKAQSQ